MAIYLCHTEPDLYEHAAEIIDVRPGAVALSRSAFHPGGGGQVGDIGRIEWVTGAADVTHVEIDGDTWWHVFADETATPDAVVQVSIDADHRLGVAALHTMSHVLNAMVFDEFAGIAVMLGIATPGTAPEERADRFLDALRNRVTRVGIPTDLTAYGVTVGDLDDLSLAASRVTRLLDNNRRPVGLAEIRVMYERVLAVR